MLDIESQGFTQKSRIIMNNKFQEEKNQLQVCQDSKFFKVLTQLMIVGDSQTGKSQLSSLLTRRGYFKFLQTSNVRDIYQFGNKGNWNQEKTKGCEVKAGIRNTQNEEFCLKIYDLTGDKTQRNYLDIYFSQKHNSINGIVYCFDVTNLKTLENIKKWIKLMLHKSTKEEINFPKDNDSLAVAAEQASVSNSASISIPEEKEYLIQYQQYKVSQMEFLFFFKGFNKLSQLPILLVGCKMDYIQANEQYNLRQKIIKQTGKLFQCNPGDNLFLLSTTQIYETHNEFVRLESCFQQMFMDFGKNVFKPPSHNSSNNESRVDGINSYVFQLSALNSQITFDQYQSINRYITNPIGRQCAYLRILCRHWFRSLTCKKQKK